MTMSARFFNTFWQELFRLSEIELTSNTSYHPHTDGHIEIVMKVDQGIPMKLCVRITEGMD
jgi:hypothetical protein